VAGVNWLDFWDRDTPIYVSERHKTLHYQLVANDLVRLIPSPEALVLDFGCGEALSADRVARKCARLYLCDGATSVRDRLADRFRAVPNVQLLAPEGVEQLPDHHLDLVVANSVAQYLTFEELRALVRVWRAKLKPEGCLVLADIIPHEVGALTDARALLRFAVKGGFLLAALAGLARTALSDYRKLRDELGITRYSEAEMLDLLRSEGFLAERRPENMGHNPARMTFVARRDGDAGADAEN
jgi:SAM-dependent methyltransferase